MNDQTGSRIPSFYKLSVSERVAAVHQGGWLNEADFDALNEGSHTLSVQSADRMIENVIGVMGLPVGLGLNFLINGRDYVVPLAVEEPSVVAALSAAAKLTRDEGGFTASCADPLLIGQVQVVNAPHPMRARNRLLQRREQLINLANSLQPRLVARGGGARELEVFIHPSSAFGDMLVLHLLVDTCDAMGANLVNTMCEGIAAQVEKLTGGKVFLRILSNLTDRSLVQARTTIKLAQLDGKGADPEQVRDGIIIASELARIDPYRAATHNKGIMNGIDALALATGNDWRSIEAGAHAYAARGGRYTSLSQWSKDDNGDLAGVIEVPIKVGIVGGPLQSNPTVAVNLRLLRVKSAVELAEVMAAVGLAQNLSALRALATEGIQKGHMTLHARSVAVAAGATPEMFDTVVRRLIQSDQIKVWKAREIVATVKAQSQLDPPTRHSDETPDGSALATAYGKAILMGEHAVVYGSHAIAAPIPLAVQCRVSEHSHGVHLSIPRWGIEHQMERDPQQRQSYEQPAARILEQLDLIDQPMRIEVYPNLPRAMGLGGSAAVAVAIIRGLDQYYTLGLDDEAVNKLAFEAERLAHGNPSGVDNAVATFGRPILFRRGDPPTIEPLEIPTPLPLVIGMTGVESLTAGMVARVGQGWERNRALYDRMFDQVDQLTLSALKAIRDADWPTLGQLMNVCHGLLNAFQVSCWELEELVQIARENGALGAKLSGGGGGGSMIALCPDNPGRVVEAMEAAGYQAMEVVLG